LLSAILKALYVQKVPVQVYQQGDVQQGKINMLCWWKLKKDVLDITMERHCWWQKHNQKSVRDLSNRRFHCGG